MYPMWKDVQVAQSHFEDLRREAEVERLLRSGLTRPEGNRRHVALAWAWFVGRLQYWRGHLGAPAEMPDCVTADC